MYVAVLASNNGRSHSHNDTGNFVIYQDGQPVAIDVGVEAYTAKTFCRERYSIWTMQSAFHNLPTVGGVMQHERRGIRGERPEVRNATTSARRFRSILPMRIRRKRESRLWIRTVTLDRGAASGDRRGGL